MNSGNTYRFRPDGSHAEYFTHGQVNPFGLAFDPLGNLYSCDCHTRPIYQLLRGAWYPSFGKPHDGLGFGPEMVTHDHGSTAIAGISYYAADQFPEAYRDTIFIGNVVTNRINHDRIEWHGSTPKGIEQPDFVWSDDHWFRPGGHQARARRRPVRRRLLQPHHRPLRGAADPPRPRPHAAAGSGGSSTGAPDGKPAPGPPRRSDPVLRRRTVEDLGHPNLAVRITAANQLVERASGEDVVAAVRAIMRRDAGPRASTASGSCNATGPSTRDPAGLRRDSDRELRVHPQEDCRARQLPASSPS